MAIEIPEHRLEVSTSRSGGPGGQHVNKTETKVEIRFRLSEADWIPERVRSRLRSLYAQKLTREGEFILSSQETRSQEQNYERCLAKLRECLEEASREPKIRRKTKPTRGSRERRIQAKKKNSAKKAQRRGDWD